jgi:hypothetical protein
VGYVHCQVCRTGTYPLDKALDVSPGRLHRDVQQAAVDLATEVPYATAATLFGQLSGLTVSRKRTHTITHQVAAGLGGGEVAPSHEEIDQCVAQVAADRCRRPVLMLGIDGAYVRDGVMSGAKPRGFASTSSMVSGSSIC